MIEVRRIKSDEAGLYREVRLAALADSPHAFGTTFAEASTRSEESWFTQTRMTAGGSDRATFFAFNGEAVVGLAAIYRDETSPNIGDLIQVWISPTVRGTGVGRRLVEALLTWAATNDFRTIKTEVTLANADILPFYQKLGFLRKSETSGDHLLELSLFEKNIS